MIEKKLKILKDYVKKGKVPFVLKRHNERKWIRESDKKKAQEIIEKVEATLEDLEEAAIYGDEMWIRQEAFDRYKRTAGETESRNTEKRALMGKRERLEKMLADTEDVAREDQIILGGAAKGLKSAIEENATERKRYKIENADEAGANKNEVERAKKLWDEMGARSPFFKRWFGDWETSAILKGNSVFDVHSSDIPIINGKIIDTAKAWISEHPIKNISVSTSDGVFDIEVTPNGIQNSFGHTKYKNKIFVLPAIESVIKKGAYLGQAIDTKDKGLKNFYFAAPVKIDGQPNVVFVRIRQMDGDKKRFYVHEVYTQEEIEKEADVLQTVDALKKGLPHGKTPASMYRSIIKNGFDVKNVSKIVDENGEPEVFYHGTQRADRVGSVFRKDRATSGTMAYFTNNKNVAENYSKNKQDTSRLNEETAYTHWFFVNGLDLESYGKTLTRAQNDKLLEKLKHIGYDYENVSYGETSDAMVDPRHWDMVYREKKGNAIMTAVEVFLNDGNMIDNEKKFLEVLKLLGVKEKDITMDFPTEQYPGVYEVYLNIKNPFNTENIPKEIVKQLEQAAKKAPKPEYKEGVDHWDKNSADPKRWITKLKEDINNGTTYAWTSIPDWVSDVLKANGYDGIIDKGGKYNDNPEHKVVIPFESEQIKSVENRGTFDKRNKDIRYKIEEDISKPLTEKEVRNPDRLKNITLITNADTLKNTAGYDDGKAGNMKAAGQLIRNLMSNPARQEKVDDLIRSNPGAIVLGVHAEEAKGRNYIPRKFADYIAKRGKNNGITADKEIVQTNKVGRTGQGEKERIDRMPIFAGKVVKGGKYILTDDLAAMGTTLSALRYYIESNGGEVVGVVTLAGGMFSSQLTPNPKEVVDFDKQLKVEFGISLRNLLKEIGYYDGQEKYLTNRELRAFRRQAIDIKRNRGIEGEQSSLQRALREAIRRHRTTSRLSQEKSNPKNTKPNPKNRPKYKIEKSDKVEKKLSGRQTSLMDDDLDNADNALKSSIDKFDEFDDFGNIDNSLNSAKKIKTFFDVNFRNAKQGIENLSEQAKSIKGFEDNILGLKSRLQGGNAGRVKAALYFNTFKLNAKGNIEITGEGLKPIIDDAIKELKKDGIGAERAFNDLNDYLISQRYVNDLERRGKATENKINAAKKTLSKLTKKYKDLDKFEAIAERLFGFQKRVLSNYVDSGVLSQERFDTILKLNPHYIPLQRVFNDIEKAQGQNLESKSLYAIDPSDLLEKNAFQSIIKNTARIIEFAVQNDIKREIAGLSKDFPDEINKKNFFYERDGASEKASKLTPQEIANESFDLYLKKRAEQRNKITVFHYYDNGKLKFIEVSDPIAAGLRQIPELGRVWKLLTIPTRLLRSGATTFSLRFLVRNPVRDSLVAFMQAKNGFTPIYHSLKGLKSLLTKDEYYKKFLESGGSFGSFMDMSDASLLKFAKSLFNVGGWKQEKWKTVWEYTLGNLEKLNETMEQMTRIGVFKAAKEKGLTDAQAGFEAREATLDFARMGTAIKYANQIVPFLNAGIQGVDTMWRAFKGNKLGFTMKGLLALTLPSMIMEVWYLCYADDDDRDEFLEIPEYERNIYWFFKTKGKWIKIPKPFSLGFIFGSVPERIIESVYKRAQGINDKSAREELWEILMGVIASVSPIQDVGFVIPPIVKVPIENMSNYSFFMERNLYSPYLDKLPASERYNANTSNIAKWIGKNTNTSPAKWDNAIRGFLGTGGADLASLSGGTKQEPILSAVMERDPVGFNSRSVGEFWNKYKKYSEVHAEFKRKAERADNDINDYIRKHSKQLNNYEAARGFYKTITAQSAAIKAIEKSEIPKWKKEEVVRTIGKQMTQQARMANEVMGR
ncbi:MAG: hypothetical protein LBQ37_00560 [Elusimicrobiota bacterium]|nr:hypothetical protein [Elusimicrobiota bacterium]